MLKKRSTLEVSVCHMYVGLWLQITKALPLFTQTSLHTDNSMSHCSFLTFPRGAVQGYHV